jgi:hypothetical protein
MLVQCQVLESYLSVQTFLHHKVLKDFLMQPMASKRISKHNRLEHQWQSLLTQWLALSH